MNEKTTVAGAGGVLPISCKYWKYLHLSTGSLFFLSFLATDVFSTYPQFKLEVSKSWWVQKPPLTNDKQGVGKYSLTPSLE